MSETPTANEQGAQSQPPIFQVVDFTTFPRAALDPADECDRLILTLAAVFNDLKDAQWNMNVLDSQRPQALQLIPADGEWVGMRLRSRRVVLSIVHELIQALQAAHSKDLLGHAKLIGAIEATDWRIQDAWSDLLELANGETQQWILNYLLRIRNNITFHYTQPDLLVRGFRRAFVDLPVTDVTHKLLASLGDSIAESRFYFADEAARGAMETIKVEVQRRYASAPSSSDEFDNRVFAYLLTLTGAIRYTVESYLNQRTQELKPADAR